MASQKSAERRSRLMSRVANAAFTNHPGFFGRLAQKMMSKQAAPLEDEFLAELYEGLE